MRRGLLWLAGGFVALGLLLAATAPELLSADAGALGSIMGVVLAAAVPGLVIVGVIALRARHARGTLEKEDR